MPETSKPLACLACGHTDDKHSADELAHGIFQCHECGARMAYGTLMPRIVVEPHTDERGNTWLRRRFQDPKTKEELFVVDIDMPYGASEAKNILSLVIP